MSRYRIKTLLGAVWAILDVEFEHLEGATILIGEMAVQRAAEMQVRTRIVETLGNSTLKGKRLIQEVERQVQELVQLKRQHAEKEMKGEA